MVNNFTEVHHATLGDELEIQDSHEYFESETLRITNFRHTLQDWLSKAEYNLRERNANKINHQDSISSAGSRTRRRSNGSSYSRRSSRSSVLSCKTIASVKKAALAAEAATLQKKQALPEEELHLKQQDIKYRPQQEEVSLRLVQQKQRLLLETEVAKIEAEEEVYAKA